MSYLAVCCIVKDEDACLKEWLAYHSLIGVEHFYIYDDMSKVSVATLLGDYIDKERVRIIRIRDGKKQLEAYAHCLGHFGRFHKWIGFIDADEFVCPAHHNDLRNLLALFEDYAGLGINWKVFSSSGHIKRPAGLVVANYTRTVSAEEQINLHIKSFVQPQYTLRVESPHAFAYTPGMFCVNDAFFPLPRGSSFSFSGNRLVATNHYFYKSQQDFEEKIARGFADMADPPPERLRKIETFYSHLSLPEQEDHAILRFAPALERAMSEPRMPRLSSPPVSSDTLAPFRSPAARLQKTLWYLKTRLQDSKKIHRLRKRLRSLWLLLFNRKRRPGMESIWELIDAGRREEAGVQLQRHRGNRRIASYWAARAAVERWMTRYDRAETALRAALSQQDALAALYRPEAVSEARVYEELVALRLAQGREAEARRVQRFVETVEEIYSVRLVRSAVQEKPAPDAS